MWERRPRGGQYDEKRSSLTRLWCEAACKVFGKRGGEGCACFEGGLCEDRTLETLRRFSDDFFLHSLSLSLFPSPPPPSPS